MMERPRLALLPGVLSMHVLPADHHDRDWDSIIVPREVKERLLAETVPEIAARRPFTVVLIDEVESFAVPGERRRPRVSCFRTCRKS